MAGFVRKMKKWPQCVSNRCKDSFSRKKYFGARDTLSLLRLVNVINTIYVGFLWRMSYVLSSRSRSRMS